MKLPPHIFMLIDIDFDDVIWSKSWLFLISHEKFAVTSFRVFFLQFKVVFTAKYCKFGIQPIP